MKLHELSPAPGSAKTAWRRGRGPASGNGKTGGRGHKGQNARSGGGVRPGFEGGQLPLYRRLPKHGFKNVNRLEYQPVSLKLIDDIFTDGEVVDNIALIEVNLIKNLNAPVKVLGSVEMTKKLTIKVQAFSKSAKDSVEKKGGKCEVVSLKDTRVQAKKELVQALLNTEAE